MDELILKPGAKLLDKNESKEISSFEHSGLGPLLDNKGTKASFLSVFNPKDKTYQNIYFTQVYDKDKQQQ
jgi:hypothetical protein